MGERGRDVLSRLRLGTAAPGNGSLRGALAGFALGASVVCAAVPALAEDTPPTREAKPPVGDASPPVTDAKPPAAEGPSPAPEASPAPPRNAPAAMVLPTVTPIEDCAACPAPHRPDPVAERQLAALSRELDSVVVDAVQDLGLVVDVSARPGAADQRISESDLVERAAASWVISPRISTNGRRIVLRILAVAPGSRVILVRQEEIRPEELEVRAVLMLRDVVRAVSPSKTAEPLQETEEHGVVKRARSRGRAVLALNAAVLGGYIGFSLQRAGGSNDARLTYPLIALGAGLGLGGSLIVADEWDVGMGDAWFLSAGTWWPLFGAVLVADSAHASENRRFLYGTGAALGGLTLATTALMFGGMSESGALIAHSGGAFGTMLGGITDLAVRGRTDVTPSRGMGIGAISGVVVTGVLATVAPSQPPSRVLLVDLGAGLGALTGAAVASPLVFGDNVGATRNRLWLSSIALGTFAGAAVGLLTTQSHPREPTEALRVAPVAGIVATIAEPDGSITAVKGFGVRGVF